MRYQVVPLETGPCSTASAELASRGSVSSGAGEPSLPADHQMAAPTTPGEPPPTPLQLELTVAA